MNETMLLPKEEEGFVLEPVDDTGQNSISFLLAVCIAVFDFLLVSVNICKTLFSLCLLLLSEFCSMIILIQNQYQVDGYYLICPVLCLQLLPHTKPSATALLCSSAGSAACSALFTKSSAELLLPATPPWSLVCKTTTLYSEALGSLVFIKIEKEKRLFSSVCKSRSQLFWWWLLANERVRTDDI